MSMGVGKFLIIIVDFREVRCCLPLKVRRNKIRTIYEMQYAVMHFAVHELLVNVGMMGKGQKRKTTTVTIRLEPAVKAAAEIAAGRDRRSLTNLIEVLILEHCKAHKIDIAAAPNGGE